MTQRAHIVASLLFVASLLACGDDATTSPPAALTVRLEIPEGPDPFETMVSLHLEASSPDFPEVVEKVVQRGTPVLELPEIRYGTGWVLTINGYDAETQLVARGRSATFDLTPESPREVRLPLIAVERFTLASARLALARYGHSATLLPDGSGRVLVAGGFDNSGEPTDSVEIYEPVSGTFTSSSSLKYARGGHRAFLVGGDLVLVGGRDAAGLQGRVEIYPWAGGPSRDVSLATARERFVAAKLQDGTILVAGGVDDKGKIVTTTELIDVANGSRSDGPGGGPDQHGGFAFTLTDGRVIAAGGRTAPPAALGMGSWIYDGAVWSAGPTLEAGSEGAQVAFVNAQQPIIVGGDGDSGIVRAVQTFSGDSFSSLGRTTGSFHEHAMVSLGDRVLIAGGTEGPEVDIFANDALNAAGTLVRARSLFTLTALEDGTVLAIGGRVAGAATDETEIFIPR